MDRSRSMNSHESRGDELVGIGRAQLDAVRGEVTEIIAE